MADTSKSKLKNSNVKITEMKNIEIVIFLFEPLGENDMKLIQEVSEAYSNSFNKIVTPNLSEDFNKLKKVTVFMDDDFGEGITPLNDTTGVIEINNEMFDFESFENLDNELKIVQLQVYLNSQVLRLFDVLNVKEELLEEVFGRIAV